MGNLLVKRKLTQVEIQEIKRVTGFSSNQISRLHRRFQTLDKANKGYITRYELHHLHEIVLNPVGDKIVEMFFKDGRNECDFQEFARVFSVFRPTRSSTPGYANHSREGKLKFLFSVIDSNGDGHLDREEMFDLLEQMMGSKVDEEQLRLIADRMINEADVTNTGSITLKEFREVTKEMDIENTMAFVAFS